MPKNTPNRNKRTASTAAAFAGVVGLPDPGTGPRYNDGGLYAFCHQFNHRFDEIAADSRPEWRDCARTERETRHLSSH